MHHRSYMSLTDGAAPASRRIYGLDMMRAYAIFTVVYAHGYDWLHGHVSHALYILPLSDGVTIFFVLSGFLIGNILLRLRDEDRTTINDLMLFLERRWLRTVPNYLLVLAVLLLSALVFSKPLPDAPWSYAVFLQNFSAPQDSFFPESWSLPVEEWFYLLFPICLFALIGVVKPARATWLCLALFIIGPALLRLWRIEALDITDVAVWTAQVKMQVLTRLDSIAYGVLMAAILKRTAMTPALRRRLFMAGVALFIFDKVQLYAVGSTFYVLHITLLAETFAAMLVLPYLCTIRTGTGPVFQAVTGLSKVSYALYLVHLSLVGFMVIPALSHALALGDGPAAAGLRYALYWTLSLGMAYVLCRFFEQPILRLRDRIRPDGVVLVKPAPVALAPV